MGIFAEWGFSPFHGSDSDYFDYVAKRARKLVAQGLHPPYPSFDVMVLPALDQRWVRALDDDRVPTDCVRRCKDLKVGAFSEKPLDSESGDVQRFLLVRGRVLWADESESRPYGCSAVCSTDAWQVLDPSVSSRLSLDRESVAMPSIIGVTGSIATGKSTACRIMAGLGAVHCDADRLVHRLYDPGKAAFDRIVDVFGREVIGEDGYIDRRVLGSKVFGKPDEMTNLTSAIGDINAAVKGVIDHWRETLNRDTVAVMEAVNLIACEEKTARKRLVERNRFSEEEIAGRLASQRPWEERVPAADLVLFNDEGPEELKAKVTSELASLTRRCREGDLPRSAYLDWWERRDAGGTSTS